MTEKQRDSAYQLAMLALQSDRYREDPDYRDTTDNVLAWANPYLPTAPTTEPNSVTQ